MSLIKEYSENQAYTNIIAYIIGLVSVSFYVVLGQISYVILFNAILVKFCGKKIQSEELNSIRLYFLLSINFFF
jgi:hypothetical protein